MNKKSNKNLFALGLIVTGVLLTLKIFNFPFLGNFDLGYVIGLLWPLFILIPGLNMLRRRIDFGGIILTLLGGSFLLDNFLKLYNIDFNSSFVFKFFWPILLVFIGYKILTSDKPSRRDDSDYGFSSSRYAEEYDDETADRVYENNKKAQSVTFNSKKFIYDSERMAEGITRLNLNISFGGAEIIVEDDIQVILIGQYTFGGHEFFGTDAGGIHNDIKEIRYPERDDDYYTRTLIINAQISFGGIEVRRK